VVTAPSIRGDSADTLGNQRRQGPDRRGGAASHATTLSDSVSVPDVDQGPFRVRPGMAPDPPDASGDDSGVMTTTTKTPTLPTGSDEQPSWGTAPATAPAGTGSDHAADGPSGATFTPPSAPSQQPHPVTPPAARFFDTIRRSGVTRPDRGSGRMVAGVASGLARRWDLDPIVVRTAFIVLTFVGGLGISLYGLGWLFLPHPDGRIHAQQLLTGRLTAGFVGALLATLTVTDGPVPLIVAAVTVTIIVLLVRNRHPHTTAETTTTTAETTTTTETTSAETTTTETTSAGTH
jgi:phage shock protein PspC (stress-responsive transcriptional regulator)